MWPCHYKNPAFTGAIVYENTLIEDGSLLDHMLCVMYGSTQLGPAVEKSRPIQSPKEETLSADVADAV